MFSKLIAAAAISLTVATGALAQTSTGDMNEAQADFTQSSETSLTDMDRTMMEGWDDTIRGVFFMDNTMAMMRPQAEIMTNWAALSADQQASVRESCTAVEAGGRDYSAQVVAFCGWVNE